MRSSATYVNPQRTFTTNVYGNSGHKYSDAYVVPSVAMKLAITSDLACAGTYTTPLGGSVSYLMPNGATGKLSETYDIHEFGATCAFFHDLSKGRLALIGGVFVEELNYDLLTGAGALHVAMNSEQIGWRAGLAYEIPEIALRTQLLYRSGTELRPAGSATYLGLNLPSGATGVGHMPRSVEFKAQSGIAPGWLAFGSIKWTDWSVNDLLTLYVPDIAVVSANQYYWRDGWTVTGGVGHAFTDILSGALSLTWDRGVSTGWDLSGDSVTLAGGVALKDKIGGELRFGAGLTYLAAISETMYPNVFPSYNSAVGQDWAYAISGSYKVKW